MFSMWYFEHSILLANSLCNLSEVHLFIDRNDMYINLKHLVNSSVMIHEISKPRGTILNRINKYKKFINDILSLKPDVLLIQDGSIFLFSQLKRLNNVHKIVEIHDPIPHEGEKKFMKCLSAFLMSLRCDEVYVHSQVDVEKFHNYYHIRRSKIYYSSLGIQSIYKQESINDNDNNIIKIKPYVLFFGRISKYKGLEYFIKAAEIVKQSKPEINFVIAGKGEFIDKCKVKSENIILFNDYIENSMVDVLFDNCELVVLPYISATQSGVLFTALDYSKPVVATNVGGIPEIVLDTNCGILVEPKNHVALANAIIDALQKIDVYREGIHSEKYTYENVAKQMIIHIRELINYE